MLNERRLHSRYLVNFPVWLIPSPSSGTIELAAEAVDLSLGGIGIRCHAEVVASLQEHSPFPISCQIRLPLPDSGQQVRCQCRMITRRRIAQDSYHLGFKITAFEGQGGASLREYLQLQ